MRLRPTRIVFAGVLVAIVVGFTDGVRGQDAPPPDKAWIQVKLPAEATVVFGKSPTEAKGLERLFESTKLEKGKEYTYDVTATWTEDGKERKETRTILISAGKKFLLDFTKAEEKPKDKAPPKDKDTAPPKDKDTAPPKDKDKAPSKDKDTAPPKDKDAAPPKDKDAAPPKDKDKAPSKDKDVAPPKDKDAAPPKDKDKAPSKDKDAAPAKDKDSAPPKDKDAAPPKDKDAAPPKDKDSAPPKDKDKEPVSFFDPMRPARVRNFEFTYGGNIRSKPGDKVRVWLPVAASSPEQDVTLVSQRLPGPGLIEKDPQYGNRILSFEAAADEKGEIPFQVVYKVARKEVLAANLKPVAVTPEELARALKADKLGPLEGKHLDLIKNMLPATDPLQRSHQLYDVVFGHMRYAKDGDQWGRGDVLWACDSKFGNCTDFHSLFISLARAGKIPARFEMGFALPAKPGEGEIAGYHCWAWFHLAERGWVPVDISEASKDARMRAYYFGNLTADRVAFSTGRDIPLVPAPADAAEREVNFLIYPVARVIDSGQLVGKSDILPKFTYKDL